MLNVWEKYIYNNWSKGSVQQRIYIIKRTYLFDTMSNAFLLKKTNKTGNKETDILKFDCQMFMNPKQENNSFRRTSTMFS